MTFAEEQEVLLAKLKDKTIKEAKWTPQGDNLRLNFTDGTFMEVNYSCYGGVFLSEWVEPK